MPLSELAWAGTGLSIEWCLRQHRADDGCQGVGETGAPHTGQHHRDTTQTAMLVSFELDRGGFNATMQGGIIKNASLDRQLSNLITK